MSPYSSPVHGRHSLLVLVVWFAVVTGMIEGATLLLFQRINWANWGNLVHVLPSIVWVSPIVDFFILGALAMALILARRVFPNLPVTRTAFFLFTLVAVYAWLAATERLRFYADLMLAIGVAAAATRRFRRHEDKVLRFCAVTAPWLASAVIVLLLVTPMAQWLRERGALSKLPPAHPGAPNVLIIVIDTLRADHLSSYGYHRPTSPNIDSLASQSVVFDDAISAASWTLPSHASMLTGRYTFEHGADNVKPMSVLNLAHSVRTLSDHYPMLSEALAARGYRTAAFSGNRIWFSRAMGFGRGFSHFEDFKAADMIPRTVFGRRLARAAINNSRLRAVLVSLGFSGLKHAQMVGEEGVRKRASEINRSVLKWIKRDRSRPFFVFINYFDVHGPYGPLHSAGRKFSHGKGTTTDYYDDGIADVDTHIGQLLQRLDRRHLSQNTLLILTSDHGELLGEHGMVGHQNALYRQLIHVPLFIRMPGVVPGNVRIATPVSTSALPATVMSLLGAQGQESFPGPELSRLWTSPGSEPEWPYPLSELSDFFHANQKQLGDLGYMASMVNSRWHCIFHQNAGAEVFDLQNDPGESHNLAETAEGQEVMQDFASRERALVLQRHPENPATLLSVANPPSD